jgi:hypothetical protein
MEDGSNCPAPYGEEERRPKREERREARGKREEGSNCLNPLGKRREESKKCSVLADEYDSHSGTPNELWTHP